MPKKNKSDAELQKVVDGAIESMKEYLEVHLNEAVEALSKKLPEPEEKKDEIVPYTQSPAVNQAIATAYAWGRTSFTFFSTSVEYAQKNLIHNEVLKQERKALVQCCLNEIEGEETIEPAQAIEKIKLLLVANMGLSLKHKGREYIHSGDLHKRLCKILEINSDTEACRLCTEYSAESEPKEAVTTP